MNHIPPPPKPEALQDLCVPLNGVRLAALVQFVTLLLAMARGLLLRNRAGLSITNRAARKVSQHIQIVEYALRRLLVLMAVGVKLTPPKPLPIGIFDNVAPPNTDASLARKYLRFRLSELPSMGKTSPQTGDENPFWDACSSGTYGPHAETYRSAESLIRRVDTLTHILKNLDTFAKRLARQNSRKARNWLGVHMFVSPSLPLSARRQLTPQYWREFSALHSDAREVSRLWSRASPRPPP